MRTKATIIFATCIVMIFTFTGCSSKSGQYNKAKDLMENGQFSEAANIFSSITDYEDSQDLYNSCVYSQGTELMEEDNYTDAKACFESITDYKDSSELTAKCEHMITVKNDATAPTINGMNEGDTIEVKFNEDYNLKNYLDSIVTIEDDVSENLDYSIVTSSPIYDQDNGKIDTTQDGSFDFSISTEDEAHNKTAVNFSIHIDATLYINEDTEFPVLLYDSDFGKYYLNSVKYYGDWESAPDYTEGYYFEMDMENGTDKENYCYIGEAYLNDYRIGVVTDFSIMIAPGKKGVVFSYIPEEDLEEKMKGFEKIECAFFIGNAEDEPDFRRPVVIEKDAIK